MNYSIFRFTLNMHNHRSQASVSAFRGDTAIRLYVTLTDGGVPYYINDGCSAILCGTKADGTKLFNRCVIENNAVIRYDFTEQTTSCIGVANCEITLYDEDGDVITAPKFVIVVDDREASYESIVESHSERDALDALMVSARNELERAEAEDARKDAEDARKDAEDARKVAEDARKVAEDARKVAEDARVKADDERSKVIKELSHKVDNMMTSYSFDTVTSLALRQDVPSTAMPYAVLDSIGGYTKKCNNLFAGSAYGTINEQGHFVAPGYSFGSFNKEIPIGTVVSCSIRLVSGTPPTDEYASISLEGFNCQLFSNSPDGYVKNENVTIDMSNPYVYVSEGWEGCTFEIMINEGATVLPWEPYFEGLKSAKVTAVKSYGKNLVPPTIYDINNWTIDTNWAKFTLPSVLFDGDYTLTVKKNPNIDWSDAIVSIGISKDGGASWVRPDGWVDGYLITSNTRRSPVTLSLKKGDKIRLAVYPTTQDTIDKIIDIQLERGNEDTEYAPYVGLIDEYRVPEAIQALDGYGIGIKTAYNFVDLASKQFSKRVKEIVLTGTETMFSYEYQGLNGVSLTVLDGKYVRAKGVCSHGNVVTNGNAVSGNMWIGVSNSNVYWLGIMDLLGFAPTHLTNFKAYLAEQYANGTPVRIIYDSTDDTDEPITDEITDTVYLKVEGGGYIVAENDEGIEAPITMTYQRTST